jgi:hypothetical protein
MSNEIHNLGDNRRDDNDVQDDREGKLLKTEKSRFNKSARDSITYSPKKELTLERKDPIIPLERQKHSKLI